jgi:hypothetical protein
VELRGFEPLTPTLPASHRIPRSLTSAGQAQPLARNPAHRCRNGRSRAAPRNCSQVLSRAVSCRVARRAASPIPPRNSCADFYEDRWGRLGVCERCWSRGDEAIEFGRMADGIAAPVSAWADTGVI